MHGDLSEQVNGVKDAPTGTLAEVAAEISNRKLVKSQFCFTHNEECKTRRKTDVEFSGLPCEENSRLGELNVSRLRLV